MRNSQSGVRVAILGACPFTQNRGVSALGSSLVKLICDSNPDAAISFLMGHRTSEPAKLRVAGGFKTIETVNYRLSPRSPLEQQLWWIVLLSFLYGLVPFCGIRRRLSRGNRWIRTVAQADFIGDIRGGDSFSDIYGIRGFLVDCLAVWSVIWVRGAIHLLPQTYGPFRSRLARWLARTILLRADSIWCRDRGSLEEVYRLTGGKRTGALCPDVAFALEPVNPDSRAIDPPYVARPGSKLIGFNVNGLVYHGGYTRDNMFGLRLDYREFVKRLAEQLLADEANRVVLVPHTFAAPGRAESDPDACRDVIQALPSSVRDRVHLVTKEYDQHQIKGVIGMCDFFIGSRMHACIAALSQGIPTIGVAYSRKFAGVFETIGAADWVIDGRSECVGEALNRVHQLFQDCDANSGSLRLRVTAARDDLSRIFQAMLAKSGSGNSGGPSGSEACTCASLV